MLLFRNIRSLRKKFLLGFISLNLIAVGLITWLVSESVSRAIAARLETHLINAVQEQEDVLGGELEQKWRWVKMKAGNPFISEGLSGSGELGPHLGPYLRQLSLPGPAPEGGTISLFDRSGRVVAERKAAGFPVLYAENTQWFTGVIARGGPAAALIDCGGKPFVIFAAPVFAGKRTAGVLAVEFVLEFSLDRAASENHTRAALLTREGLVLTGTLPGKEAAWLASLSVVPGVPELVVHNGFLYGVGVLKAPLEAGSEYLLVMSAPLDEVNRPIAALRGYIFCIGLAVAVLFAGLVFWLSGKLLKPLRGLKSAMETIVEKADTSVRVLASGSDEIGALSAAFNLMLDSLDEKTRQLEAAGEQLSILAGITSTSPLPIMLVNNEFKIQVWNEAAEELFGWTRGEILGHSPFEAFVPEEEQKVILRLRAQRDQSKKVTFEGMRRTRAGELIPVEASSTLLTDKTGAPLGHIVVYRDLRELRKLQESMLQSEKMSAVGQLAAGVAHEINNPLGIILGFAQGLVKRAVDGDPMALPFRSIEREALRCKNLVQSLLVFSRTSKSEQRELLPLEEILKSSVTLIEARTKASNIELAVEIYPEPLKVLANTNQLQQIVVNLANNAIDAMPKGGKLALRTLLSVKKPGWAELQVEDTGGGIPEAIREKIFEPFFTTKEAGKGTGLGLALAYEILRKHDGCIEVESEEGKGTRFTVLLPLRHETGPGHGEKP